jgi:hypothetical protein
MSTMAVRSSSSPNSMDMSIMPYLVVKSLAMAGLKIKAATIAQLALALIIQSFLGRIL